MLCIDALWKNRQSSEAVWWWIVNLCTVIVIIHSEILVTLKCRIDEFWRVSPAKLQTLLTFFFFLAQIAIRQCLAEVFGYMAVVSFVSLSWFPTTFFPFLHYSKTMETPRSFILFFVNFICVESLTLSRPLCCVGKSPFTVLWVTLPWPLDSSATIGK